MFKAVQFDHEIESLVRFVEESDPDHIVAQTYQKLRSGIPDLDLLRASTLAVVRSTEVPPQHHGGPLHPVCGVHAVRHVADRLSGNEAFLPVIQHVALCNNHVHSMQMGPYLMPECEPLPGRPGDIGSFHISDAVLDNGMSAEQRDASEGINATKGAFYRSLRAMQAPAAEHYFLWLLNNVSRSDALDQLLPLAIGRNGLDDHNFLFPVYTARALDCIGWDFANVLFRPAVRCQARRAPRLLRNNYDFDDVQELIKEYKLLERGVPEQATRDESGIVADLGLLMGRNKNYLDNIEPMARALADGLSLQGAGEALSIGAAAAYISTSYGNPMDSHLHTGTNNRRYLLSLPDVSLENKLLGLLTGFTGPEVLLAERLLNWQENLDGDVTARLPKLGQAALLDAIVESIEGQPWLDWRKIGVAQTVAPDSVKETVALARQYAELGYDDKVYFDRLAEIACRDDFTEMHALKHFQAIVDEYYTTGPGHRWLHLVSAAKSAAIVHLGREHRVYHQARELIAA
ncbi:MAG: hypothetical protein O2780_12805 [Proteobacteria bacterium]|jgi:hypothetical protein|nr:hypothetical protein [Pseudomonadota bacterium]MDA1300126.1 hypothetical protein [Pseudomonadota bacterium]